MRLSSEMFPFASCEEHGYKLALFAAETLAEVGKVVCRVGTSGYDPSRAGKSSFSLIYILSCYKQL